MSVQSLPFLFITHEQSMYIQKKRNNEGYYNKAQYIAPFFSIFLTNWSSTSCFLSCFKIPIVKCMVSNHRNMLYHSCLQFFLLNVSYFETDWLDYHWILNQLLNLYFIGITVLLLFSLVYSYSLIMYK